MCATRICKQTHQAFIASSQFQRCEALFPVSISRMRSVGQRADVAVSPMLQQGTHNASAPMTHSSSERGLLAIRGNVRVGSISQKFLNRFQVIGRHSY